MNTIKIDINLLTKTSWNEQETNNVELLADFVQKLMNDHDSDYVKRNLYNTKYKQHNRAIPDGLDALTPRSINHIAVTMVRV